MLRDNVVAKLVKPAPELRHLTAALDLALIEILVANRRY